MRLWSAGLEVRESAGGAATRRHFLGGLAALSAAALAAPGSVLAAGNEERVLSFLHTHSQERLSVAYYGSGAYIPQSLVRLEHFLRDHRTGDEHEIDPKLYDILYALRQRTGAKTPFQVISGYRSPATNRLLRARSGGVAQRSLHLQGKAIDIRLADVGSAVLRDAALELRRGGVGYYRRSDFVHVDTGRVRHW
jgi:uncharacterized protein YcbK (DUF882 family)